MRNGSDRISIQSVLNTLVTAGVPAELLSADDSEILYQGPRQQLRLRRPSRDSEKAVCKFIRATDDGSVEIEDAYDVRRGEQHWIIDVFDPPIRYIFSGTQQQLGVVFTTLVRGEIT